MSNNQKATSGKSPIPFWKLILMACFIILSVSIATHFEQRAGCIRTFETASLDNILRLKKPIEPQDIVIVGITESDYKELFDRKSPLRASVLEEIIKAIALGKPK